jgi:hypothetical protein
LPIRPTGTNSIYQKILVRNRKKKPCTFYQEADPNTDTAKMYNLFSNFLVQIRVADPDPNGSALVWEAGSGINLE